VRDIHPFEQLSRLLEKVRLYPLTAVNDAANIDLPQKCRKSSEMILVGMGDNDRV
jgi:hypothetical protein